MLPPKPIWEWHKDWEGRSKWENRYTTMSDAEILTFDLACAAKSVCVPVLMVHGDNSDGDAFHQHGCGSP